MTTATAPRRPIGLAVVFLAAGYAACGSDLTPADADGKQPIAMLDGGEAPPTLISAPLDRSQWPSQPLIVRDCATGPEGEMGAIRTVGRGSGQGYGSGGSSGIGAGPSGGAGTRTATAPAKPSPKVAVSAPPPPPAAPMAGQAMGDSPAAAPVAEASPDPRPREAAKEKKSEIAVAEPDDRGPSYDELANTVPAGPKVDWGATVYLSNDDSMSLASAQHLLHAVDKGMPFRTSEIRPHELLNYFSFDYAPAPEGGGKLFSVLPSAEKIDADTLTVALAVRGAMPQRKPLDLTVVVDRSGSMAAEGRMTYVQRALAKVSGHLVAGDRVDFVWFDNEICTPVENFVVGRDDARVIDTALAGLAPRGGTNIGIGLREGYRIAADPSRSTGIGRNRRVMLLTDALANQGTIDAAALGQVGEGFDKLGIRLTGVGVGEGFNDKILDEVTERGKGAYVYLGSEAVVDRLFGPGFRSLTETIATDVQFALDLPDSVAMERFYGEEASTDKADIQTITYNAGTTQLFLQDLVVDPDKVRPADQISLLVTFRDAATGEPGKQTFTYSVGELLNADRHNLHKGRALMAWTDLLTAKSMGADPCGEPTQTYATRAAALGGDAEIGYVNKLVGKWCRLELPEVPVASAATVPFKVRVDSDVPIAEVALACGSKSFKQAVGGGDNIARFEGAPAGACTVTLEGMVPLSAAIDVPAVGGDVKCTVRGGRVSCG